MEDQVLERTKRGLLFSLLDDECRESSGKQMLSLFFRYVWFDEENTKYSVHEDFVVFLRCQKVSGGELFNILIEYVTEKNIPMENGRGQAYEVEQTWLGATMDCRHMSKQLWP